MHFQDEIDYFSFPGSAVFCSLCEHHWDKFLPYQRKQYYKHVPGRLGELFIAHVLSEAPVIPSSEKQAIPDKASQYLLTVSWVWNPEQEALKQSSTSFQNNTVRRWLSCVKQSLNHPCYGSPVFSLICFPHKVSRLLFDTSLFGKKTAEM